MSEEENVAVPETDTEEVIEEEVKPEGEAVS